MRRAAASLSEAWVWRGGLGNRLGLAVLLAILAGGALAAAPAGEAGGVRIRQIEEGRDGSTLRRIEAVRSRLPEKYRRRHNFAWAVARIEGLGKTEYYAHSGIKRKGDLSSVAAAEVESISWAPKKRGRFAVLCVNHDDVVEGPDCWLRHVDTEYKILEDVASRLPDASARGRMALYTDLYPCASCRNVMGQFLAVYTNVQMRVLYREH